MSDEYGMLQDLVDDLWLEERESRVDAAQRKGRREGAIQAARKVIPVLAQQEKKIVALIDTLSSVEDEQRKDNQLMQAAQDDLIFAKAEVERLRKLADESGKWRRAHTALDDIRCAILDAGWPLGDDSDPELTPLRLVQALLEERKKTANALDLSRAEAKVCDKWLDTATNARVEVEEELYKLQREHEELRKSKAQGLVWHRAKNADGTPNLPGADVRDLLTHTVNGGMCAWGSFGGAQSWIDATTGEFYSTATLDWWAEANLPDGIGGSST